MHLYFVIAYFLKKKVSPSTSPPDLALSRGLWFRKTNSALALLNPVGQWFFLEELQGHLKTERTSNRNPSIFGFMHKTAGDSWSSRVAWGHARVCFVPFHFCYGKREEKAGEENILKRGSRWEGVKLLQTQGSTLELNDTDIKKRQSSFKFIKNTSFVMIHNSSLPCRIDNRGWTEIKVPVNIKIFHNNWEKKQ